MLLDSLNCIVLASATDHEDNDSDTNSRHDMSNNMANTDNNSAKTYGTLLHFSFMIIVLMFVLFIFLYFIFIFLILNLQ